MTVTQHGAGLASVGAASRSRLDPWVLGAIICAIGSALVQFGGHMNWDVSWLIEVGERTLDGAVPYVDFQEVNPPASILLYIPAILLGRLMRTSPEALTIILVFVCAAASGGLCASILSRGGVVETRRWPMLICGAAFALLVLPMSSFAQREHIVVLAVLPMLATLSVRLSGKMPGAWTVLAAGLGAGLAICIKPMFLLVFLGPMVLLVRRQSLRTALRTWEAWIAICLAAIYGAAVIVLFPAYTERLLPLAVAVYFPARRPWYELLSMPRFVAWLLLAFVFARLARVRGKNILGTVLVLASGGFEAIFLLMGKAFSYHAYPGLALAIMACALLLPARPDGEDASQRRCTRELTVLASVTMLALFIFAHHYDPALASPGLAEAIKALPPHPRVMAATGNLALAHPFVREIGGTWVSSAPYPWVYCSSSSIVEAPETDSRFAPLVRAEQDAFAKDLVDGHADVILVDGAAWLPWFKGTPALARAFESFQQIGTYGAVMLWTRKAGP